MNTTVKKQIDTTTLPIVREYEIEGKKYIVTATTKAGATESAATKVRRLIRNELNKNAGK